jgi:tRNA(Ile)-lysidine synthase
MSEVKTTPPGLMPPPPGGGWVAAVSGGRDSVGMLLACRERVVGVVHVNHELRGEESEGDARFVEGLGFRSRVVRRSARGWKDVSPAGLRRFRLGVCREAVAEFGAEGLLLGHHADDQAETVMLRVLRGGEGVWGMRRETVIGGMRVFRPLLSVRREAVTAYLRGLGQSWREDSSNARPVQRRNQVRRLLEGRPELVERLLRLGSAAERFRGLLEREAGPVRTELRVGELLDLPEAVARHALRQMLRSAGVPVAAVSESLVSRLYRLSTDAAEPARLSLPGGLQARRTGRTISIR